MQSSFEKPNSDTIRILVASDNHLGFLIQDPIRSTDSLRTFDEILALSHSSHCDFILLAGDLYHDSIPSRKIIVESVKSFRKHCCGEGEINVEFLSNQSDFDVGSVNWESGDISIKKPVFSIHGNHDDPVGVTSSLS